MKINIAIHNTRGSYSDRWLEYCFEKGLSFSIVDCLSTDIIRQCAEMDVLFWHWNQNSPEEILVAFEVIAALETQGKLVFPSTATCWHFDDKVAQKYLLEAVGAPMVPSFVFFSEKAAMEWVGTTAFPKVFKLRCGAGSSNVWLVKSRWDAMRFIRRAFRVGYPAMQGYFSDSAAKMRKTRDWGHLLEKLARAPKEIIRGLVIRSRLPRQRSYAYFQDFQPGNTHDTRVTVIGDRAFAFRRSTRPDDFRASGSGLLDYNIEAIDMRCVQIAFEVARKLKSQSLAFDFVKNLEGNPLIVEISYCYMPGAVYDCPGHWDTLLNWHEGYTWPQDAILEDVLAAVAERKNQLFCEQNQSLRRIGQ